MPISALPEFLRAHYEIHEWRHASGILQTEFPEEMSDICQVLERFRLLRSQVEEAGGRKSNIAGWLDAQMTARGWQEKKFDTQIMVDGRIMDSPTHKVDCVKSKVALEIEWNNKDPFYDRDLNNFRLLFDLQAISVGVIITRCTNLQEIFNRLGKGKSYGNSTTHMEKLLPRLRGGGGGGCPVLVFGITPTLFVDDMETP